MDIDWSQEEKAFSDFHKYNKILLPNFRKNFACFILANISNPFEKNCFQCCKEIIYIIKATLLHFSISSLYTDTVHVLSSVAGVHPTGLTTDQGCRQVSTGLPRALASARRRRGQRSNLCGGAR